jgi:hypothetical protein
MGRRNLFSFGGCVYRMQVDTRHAASLVMLGVGACQTALRDGRPVPHLLAEIDYMHTSNLPQGRALWLRRQIENGNGALRWAISCDGDTSFDAAQLLDELHLVDGQTAIGIAPVRIGGTASLCNINIDDADEQTSKTIDGAAPLHGRRVFSDELQKVLDGDRQIASGGFGLVVFNLAWFRQAWPDPAPERVSIHTGEDIEFCLSVRDRGGRIIALRVKTDHFAFGEKQTR